MIRPAPKVSCALATLAVSALVLASYRQVGSAQEPAVSREYEIKAVYLYHFCRYVEWPKNAVAGDDSMFVIGVLGPNVFGAHLDRLSAQTVNNKKIVVHRFASAKDYQPCHILFIAPDDMTEKRLEQVREKAKNAPLLLVGDTAGFARKGAIINFFIEENVVKFEINPDAAKRAQLKVNAQLFQLPQAKIVKDAQGGN
jgi:hypothetical protein